MTSRAGALRRVNWPGLATMVALAGLWEALVRSHVLEYQYLPAPSAIAGGIGRIASSGDLARDGLHTLQVTLLGWVLASLLGVALGVVLGLSDAVWRYSMATVEVMRAVPPVSLVPVALLVFGFSVRMELTIIVFVSAWPVLVNAIDGVRGVRAELVDVARTLRLSRLTVIRKISLPAAVPAIVVGLRLALSLSLVLAVVAEMIGNPAGLGNALVRASQALQPAEMFAYVLVIGVLGVALNAAFTLAARRLLPGTAAR
ncbi:MAG TPA: ABC transporter permease [Acidimicrobiales bacterium]|nr:ABC transporter permease [Acidimicrobiales bacterium]